MSMSAKKGGSQVQELTDHPASAEHGARDALLRIDALHIALTQIVLEGGDLDQIAEELARVLEVGVLVTSTDGRERAAALDDELRATLLAAGLLDPTGRVKVEQAGAEGVRLGDGQVRSLRVVAAGVSLGRLVCARRDRSLSAEDVRGMERAATVAALLLTRQEAVTAVENKYRGDFLRDVFLGRAGDQTYVVRHAADFGWDIERPLVVVAAELDPAGEDEVISQARQRQLQERFSAAWRQVSAQVATGVASVDFSSEVVTLLPAEDGVTELVAEVLQRVRGDKGGGRRSFSVGVSRVVDEPGGLREAYGQARRALEVGRRVSGHGASTWFDHLGLHRLIALVPDPVELRSFAVDVLGPLAGSGQEARDLRETLQVLLDTNFNVAEAARVQFFHYNTMRYRIGKLERLLGPVSSDPHLRLDVAVALRVLEIAS